MFRLIPIHTANAGGVPLRGLAFLDVVQRCPGKPRPWISVGVFPCLGDLGGFDHLLALWAEMGDIRSRRPEQIPLKDCSTVTAPLIDAFTLAVTQPRIPEKGQVASTLADHHSLPVFAVAACRPAMPKQICCVDLYDCSAVTLALPDNALVFPLVEGVESRQSAELLIGDILLHGMGQLQGNNIISLRLPDPFALCQLEDEEIRKTGEQ